MRLSRLLALLCLALPLAACQHPRPGAAAPVDTAVSGATVRVATFNVSLYSETAGGLAQRLRDQDPEARRIAAVIQRVRPDVILLNEFDFDPTGEAADLFQENFLGVGQMGEQAIEFRYRYLGPVNTGVPSGLDLDKDGRVGGSGRSQGNDAWGYGLHPGQYGMLVLSRFPIDEASVRTFQNLRWSAVPGALAPVSPDTGEPWYAPKVWSQLRLSSKSHWDIPLETPLGRIHFLAAHPTPPAFDGPERRNVARNHDEIRLWASYITPGEEPWLCDDAGVCGGLPANARFVIAGDYNADPGGGRSLPGAIQQLLESPYVLRMATPRSSGGLAEKREPHPRGNQTAAEHHTANFGPDIGNYRVDYVLPSVGLAASGSGVFWPRAGEPGAEWVSASDHRLVWVDLAAAR